MEDVEGGPVVGYQKKLLSWHNTAYITIDQDGETMVTASIRQSEVMQWAKSADIYLHEPPVSLEGVTTQGLMPSIHVEGDIMAKKYDFMMGDLQTEPYKIAKVERSWETWFEADNYYVVIGPNVDIAFICICAFAIDELFNDDK